MVHIYDLHNFITDGNRNKYSTKQVQSVSFQPYYVSILPGKTKNSRKTADSLLQCVLLNRLFQTFTECRSIFVSSPAPARLSCFKKYRRDAKVASRLYFLKQLRRAGAGLDDLLMFYCCLLYTSPSPRD